MEMYLQFCSFSLVCGLLVVLFDELKAIRFMKEWFCVVSACKMYICLKMFLLVCEKLCT